MWVDKRCKDYQNAPVSKNHSVVGGGCNVEVVYAEARVSWFQAKSPDAKAS